MSSILGTIKFNFLYESCEKKAVIRKNFDNLILHVDIKLHRVSIVLFKSICRMAIGTILTDE